MAIRYYTTMKVESAIWVHYGNSVGNVVESAAITSMSIPVINFVEDSIGRSLSASIKNSVANFIIDRLD